MTEQEERIWQLIQKEQRQKTRQKAIHAMALCFAVTAVGLFLVSPCLQMLLRLVDTAGENGFRYQGEWQMDNPHVKMLYHNMVDFILMIGRFCAVPLLMYAVYAAVQQRKTVFGDFKGTLRKLLPFSLFLLFAGSIAAVTAIRGANEYDLTGHPYMYESIYSYITYPLVFFFAGTFLSSPKVRRILLYVFAGAATAVHIAAIIDKWVVKLPFFVCSGIAAVFHQHNHYGYYIMLTIMVLAGLFVYEKNKIAAVLELAGIAVASVVSIVNNTFGAYLAAVCALLLFGAFLFFTDRKRIWKPALCLGIILAVTFAMSFSYDTMFSSFITTVKDVGKIASDSENAGSAGTGRWSLWTRTCKNIVRQPVLGFGVEGLLNTEKIGTPHNEFIQYAAFFGIPTCLLYIASCASVVIRVLRNGRKLNPMTIVCFFVSTAYLISSCFGVTIYYTTPFFFIFLGLTYAEFMHRGAPGAAKD